MCVCVCVWPSSAYSATFKDPFQFNSPREWPQGQHTPIFIRESVTVDVCEPVCAFQSGSRIVRICELMSYTCTLNDSTRIVCLCVCVCVCVCVYGPHLAESVHLNQFQGERSDKFLFELIQMSEE